jgi:hypothetical protein
LIAQRRCSGRFIERAKPHIEARGVGNRDGGKLCLEDSARN